MPYLLLGICPLMCRTIVSYSTTHCSLIHMDGTDSLIHYGGIFLALMSPLTCYTCWYLLLSGFWKDLHSPGSLLLSLPSLSFRWWIWMGQTGGSWLRINSLTYLGLLSLVTTSTGRTGSSEVLNVCINIQPKGKWSLTNYLTSWAWRPPMYTKHLVSMISSTFE